jgi:two-component system response regulator GlrR
MKEPESVEETQAVKAALKRQFILGHIKGRSKAVKKLHQTISRLSSCDVNVLIAGETGVGKEPAARAVHYLSCRAGKPFIPVNCGAIPEALFENELFGHVKGAFTDAAIPQVGLVQAAEAGTLFLDEISVVGPYIQVKLLRLLQEKEYKPLGSSYTRKADIRIIAATNKELHKLVKEGKFREDLFYRLNIVALHIPPLRERKEDIPVLVDHFLKKYCAAYDKPLKRFSEDALAAMISYAWPGNIRELENKVQHLVVMSSEPVIDNRHLHLPENEHQRGESGIERFNAAREKVIQAFERSYLVRLLTKHKGNVARAARIAGKSRTALWNLIKKHNLSPKQFRYEE